MFRGKFFLVAENLGRPEADGFVRPENANAPSRLCVVAGVRPQRCRDIIALEPVALPPLEERTQNALHAATLDAVRRLIQRCGADFELLAWMTREPALFGMRLEEHELDVLAIPNLSAPADLLRAEEAARTYTSQDFGLLDPTRAAEWHELTRRKSLLVHVCCGPDAGGVLRQLKDDYDLTAFWYDPNIQPKTEHDLRLEAFLKVCEIEGVRAVVGEYDAENFLSRIGGFEHTPEQGAKCSICYDMRLERAAIEAKAQGCDRYTTTLAISPHKVQTKLASFGGLYAQKHGVPYLARNFMKEDGFKDSVAYTREHDIYRQDYCGCWFSLYEGGPRAQGQAELMGLKPDDIPNAAKEPNAALEARFDALAAGGAFDNLPALGSQPLDRTVG